MICPVCGLDQDGNLDTGCFQHPRAGGKASYHRYVDRIYDSHDPFWKVYKEDFNRQCPQWTFPWDPPVPLVAPFPYRFLEDSEITMKTDLYWDEFGKAWGYCDGPFIGLTSGQIRTLSSRKYSTAKRVIRPIV